MSYQSATCTVVRSDLDPKDAEKLIGKTVVRVEVEEFSICFMFADGSSFVITDSSCGPHTAFEFDYYEKEEG